MIEKISFVVGIGILAVLVLFLACFGWINAFPWWKRKEYQQ